jgi:hypothetical protein
MANEKKGHDVHVVFLAPGVGTVTIDGVQMTCKNVSLRAGARKQTELTVTILCNTLNVPTPMPMFGTPPGAPVDTVPGQPTEPPPPAPERRAPPLAPPRDEAYWRAHQPAVPGGPGAPVPDPGPANPQHTPENQS